MMMIIMIILMMTMVVVMCFLDPKGPLTGSARGGRKTMMMMMIMMIWMMMMMIKMMMRMRFFVGFYYLQLQYSDKRWFQASVPLFQGMGKVGLLTVNLVLDLSLHHTQYTVKSRRTANSLSLSECLSSPPAHQQAMTRGCLGHRRHGRNRMYRIFDMGGFFNNVYNIGYLGGFNQPVQNTRYMEGFEKDI